MFKPLLSLVLAATHLVSWSAAPLYLCISHDGSMCIDAGPDDCDCCHETAAASHEHDACPASCDHDHAAAVVDTGQRAEIEFSLASNDACDCEHLAISGSSAPVIVRTSNATDAGKFIAMATTHASLAPLSTPAILGHRAELFEQPSSTLFLATVLRSVVMRC